MCTGWAGLPGSAPRAAPSSSCSPARQDLSGWFRVFYVFFPSAFEIELFLFKLFIKRMPVTNISLRPFFTLFLPSYLLSVLNSRELEKDKIPLLEMTLEMVLQKLVK